MNPSQLDELVNSASIDGTELVTSAVLVLRATNMDTGEIALHIGSTADTDWVSQLGMIEWARRIVLRNVGRDVD